MNYVIKFDSVPTAKQVEQDLKEPKPMALAKMSLMEYSSWALKDYLHGIFRKPNVPTIYIPPQFLAIHNSHLDSCINTIGDTILMQVEPWFSHEVGKDFRKWENGGES